jgi:HEPN superfamily protein
MTYAFKTEFASRRNHVKRYLAVVSRTEREMHGVFRKLSEDRLNVLRAGSFLILYNLIESTARSAVQEIHDRMRVGKVPFASLKRSIRRQVIKGFKKRSNPETHLDMTDVPLELVAAALDVEDYFSGNIDARRLREIAEVYGFPTNSDRSLTHDGAELLTIKNIRNDLAHGIKTYEEVGRDYPIKQLLEISIRSTAYMAAILDNVSVYLDTEQFRELPEKIVAA